MKKSILVALSAAMITSVAFGQKKETSKLPTAVETAFLKKFPESSKVVWKMENEKEWEAEFKMNGVEYSANFLSDGKWLETEQEIKTDQLPAEVQETLKTQFADYKIDEAEMAETIDGTVYEIELEKGKSKSEVVISPSGVVLKKEVEEEGHGDKED